MKHGLHTIPQKPSSSQSVGITVNLPASRNSGRICWHRRWCSHVLEQTGILLINFLTRGETVNAEHYCKALQKLRWAIQNKRLRMPSASFVLLHDNIWPHTAWWSILLLQEFNWVVLIIHLIVLTSCSLFSIFYYTTRNSYSASIGVFRMTERRRRMSHYGSNPRQTSMTQGYKSWSHSMTNVSIPEVNMLKNSWILAACVQWIFPWNWVLFL